MTGGVVPSGYYFGQRLKQPQIHPHSGMSLGFLPKRQIRETNSYMGGKGGITSYNLVITVYN